MTPPEIVADLRRLADAPDPDDPTPPPVSPRLRTLLAQHGTRRPKET